eukprot:6189645-Pleurochrysis_carterae.AAC.1
MARSVQKKAEQEAICDAAIASSGLRGLIAVDSAGNASAYNDATNTANTLVVGPDVTVFQFKSKMQGGKIKKIYMNRATSYKTYGVKLGHVHIEDLGLPPKVDKVPNWGKIWHFPLGDDTKGQYLDLVTYPSHLIEASYTSAEPHEIFAFTRARDILFEEGVTRLPFGMCASSACSRVSFPSTLQRLEDNIFINCKNLHTVVFNAKIVSMHRNAFRGTKFEGYFKSVPINPGTYTAP